jgi:hypothetical protein
MNYAPLHVQRAARSIWLGALHSNRYRQAIGGLRCQGGYDVLGVLCNELKTFVKGEWRPCGFFVRGELRSFDLPPCIMEITGLRTAEGRPARGEALTIMNDHGMSLMRLADFIASEPEGLFVDEELA